MKSHEKSVNKGKIQSKTDFQDQTSNNNSSIFDSKLDVMGNISNTKPQSEFAGGFIDCGYEQLREKMDGSVINNISLRKGEYVTGGDRPIGQDDLEKLVSNTTLRHHRPESHEETANRKLIMKNFKKGSEQFAKDDKKQNVNGIQLVPIQGVRDNFGLPPGTANT